MKRRLNVLLIEDSPTDARLILRELAQSGYEAIHATVATEAEMRAALDRQSWDIVLSDYALPHFSGAAALRLLRERDTDAPFIFVSGEMGEETAVGAMRSGAQDYVMKDSLARLAPAIERELGDAAVRREARLADRAMRESEHKYRHLFEALSDAAFLMDANSGRIIDTNAQAEKLLGRSRPEILGRPHTQFYADGAQPPLWPAPPTHDRPAEPSVTETEILRTDSRVVPVSVSHSSLELHGRPLVLALFRDITERKLAEAAVLAREREFRTLAEHTPDLIVRWDRELRRCYANPAFAAEVGVTVDAIVGQPFGTLYPEIAARGAGPALAQIEACIRQVFATGAATQRSFQWTSPAGKHFFQARFVPESLADGSVGTVLCIARDISEIKEAERQVLALTENSPDIIVRFDRESRYLYVNGAMERANGIPAAELLGTRFGDQMEERHPGLATGATARLRATNAQVFATGDPVELEMPLPLPAGPRLFNVRFIPESDDAGQVATVLCIARDITERKKAEEALRESEQRFRQVTENIEEVFWLSDATKQTMIYVSPAFAAVWGRSCESLYAAPDIWLEAVHPDDRARVRAAVPLQAQGGYDIEYRIVAPDRATRWIHDRAFPVFDAQGKCFRIAGIAENITTRRQLEEQFRQSQKMEAVGQLASGIAHDFNNLLTVIQMQSSMLLADPSNAEKVEAGIQQIADATKRAADLTRQLLTFSRRTLKEARSVDLGELAGNMLKLMRRVLGEEITLELRCTPALPLVHADPGMIEQVLMNLLVNARDAMPRGGRISLTLEQMTIDAGYVALHPAAKAGPHVCFSVADTGSGIAPEIRSRIFEPFFTTKEPGKGTGLGLATVFGIVQQHGGSIEVESEVGRGTTFRLLLPALARANGSANQVPKPAATQGGTESILLVEDDPTVRAVSSIALRRHGYKVVEARSATEVLERWPTLDGKIDLLVTDIVMPGGVTGQKLAKELLKRRPDLKIVFTTGYSNEALRRQLKLETGWNYLPKPYSFSDLTTIVRRRLDDDRPPLATTAEPGPATTAPKPTSV